MDGTISLSKALSGRMQFLADRQGVIAGNIANADTPGYVPADLEFKAQVANAQGKMAMRTTDGQHMAGTGGPGASGKRFENARYVQHNGNAVRLDDQMIKMNQTQLDYRMMTEIYSKNRQLQKIAIGRSQ
jgi:flagellar basal-body rod protein FlgB